MYRRRLIPLMLSIATLGALSLPSQVVATAPAVIPGTSRRAKTPRRAFARMGAPLPGKKGQAQKHQGKACRHRKAARNRRRAARVKGR